MKKNTTPRPTLRAQARNLRSVGALALIKRAEAIISASARFSAAVEAGKFEEAARIAPLLKRKGEIPDLLARAECMLRAAASQDADRVERAERRRVEAHVSTILGREVRLPPAHSRLAAK